MTKPTTEARRHEEKSGNQGNSRNRVIGEAIYSCRPERVEAKATPSRRTPTKIVPERAASGSSHETTPTLQSAGLYQGTGFSRAVKRKLDWALAPALFRGVTQTIRAMLREIFDESAYDRYLLRTHASRSVASYREFTRERDAALLKKPRCC